MSGRPKSGEAPEGMTRAEIAERLGISVQRVGQIEKQALEKLRRLMEKEARQEEERCRRRNRT